MRRAAWVLVSVVGVLLAACTTTKVPMPPDDASPDDVVRAYVATLAARDCETAKALFAPNRVGDGTISENSCGHLVISNLEVTRSVAHPPATGISADMATGWEQAWDVDARFDVTGGGISLRDGNYPMTFLLVRSTDTDPWRLVGFGMG